MKVFIFFLLAALMTVGAPPVTAGKAESTVGFQEDFSGPAGSEELPEGWKPLYFKKIPRHTRYKVVREGNDSYLQAESHASASGIYREVALDPKRYRYLSWRWKVHGILSKGDARSREGDDYPARIYVTFQYDPEKASVGKAFKYGLIRLWYGKYPPSATITYIWANRLPKGESIPNAYTGKTVMMMAVESGDGKAGQWVEEHRDVYADFRRLFKEEPPAISGIGIMTDTDNTGEKMTAGYDDFMLSAVPSR
ncbi:MAG: DUF3047 domain-containing protein [Deltaproteobacteria bacterium]|nr:DUF3047 domain-containing protein [Deltaproteobacteria bacterium]